MALEAFLKIFREKAASVEGGLLSYRDFIDLALYHPKVGYYRRSHKRIGYTARTDFYTAVSLGPMFGRLVVAAIRRLLGKDVCERSTFVEIGAEPGQGLLDGLEHPFAAVHVLRRDDPMEIPAHAVVFANELLDAQPFHRLRVQSGHWQELGVRLKPQSVGGTLEEAPLPQPTPEAATVISELPSTLPEGYCLDLPLPAETFLAGIVTLPWKGLWLTFDYGTSLNELLTAHPHGTGRTYRRHRLGKSLLEHPGESDITCHLCWDRLTAVLKQNPSCSISSIGCEPQERFFMAYAREAIEPIVTSTTAAQPFTPEAQTLKQLLHPGHMGLKFQAFWAIRQP